MDEYREEQQNQNGNSWAAARASANRWLVVAVLALLVVSAVALAYGYHQQAMVRQLTAQAGTTNLTTNQLQSQVNTLTARLNEIAAAQGGASSQLTSASVAEPATEASTNVAETPAAPSVSVNPASPSAPAKGPAAKRRAPMDKRYTQLQAQLAEQNKQLKDTQEQVKKYRSDLEGNISSTRDELNGSIARTHEELVALEKRGERNYVEFDLTKSKQFQRVGSLSLSLRKADTKHKSYDLAMIVDDNQLTKKQVNLYEPVSIHTDNESQPVQVVVNRIEKNLVHGYISSPKYKPSELSSATATTVTPVAVNPAANSTPNPQQPQP
jgi:DNA repair exonuclease SbcCD ATPase subunit